MIGRADIEDRVRAWGLREDVVEKDYVLGWVLWSIGADPVLGRTWIFKGGTCLKKCYNVTSRFSEDLDFTVVEDGPIEPDAVLAALDRVGERAGHESGIDFAAQEPVCRMRPSGRSSEGRLYYRGPRNAPSPARIRLDLTGDETVARPPIARDIDHDYPDALPAPGRVRCYSFEEVFAEKLRALGERARPRDLYDVVHLSRQAHLPDGATVREILAAKCAARGIPEPSYESIRSSPLAADIEAEWASMLAHQVNDLDGVERAWSELPGIFAWLRGEGFPESGRAR